MLSSLSVDSKKHRPKLVRLVQITCLTRWLTVGGTLPEKTKPRFVCYVIPSKINR